MLEWSPEVEQANDPRRRDRMWFYASLVIVFVVAFALRIYYLTLVPTERLDDGYARWLMAVLTARNGWVYSDLRPMPNLAVVYLPLNQYLVALLMAATGNFSVAVGRYLSLAAGTATCLAATGIARKLFSSAYPGLLAGLFLAVQPWHIDFSLAGSDEALTGLLASLAVYYTLTKHAKSATVATALAALTSYEGWLIILLAFGAILLLQRRHGMMSLRGPLLAMAAVGAAWMGWSQLRAGQPIAWFTGHLAIIGWSPAFEFNAYLFYPTVAVVMTSGLFLIAIALGARKRPAGRILAISLLLFLLVMSLGATTGVEVSDLDRLVPALPLMALALAAGFPRIHGTLPRRALIALVLVALLVVPYYLQAPNGPKKLFIINPEERVALSLREHYTGGTVVTDLATIIYYSGLDPAVFLSFDHIKQFAQANGPDKLADWFRANHVSFLIWQNMTHSRAAQLFPLLGLPSNFTPNTIRIGGIRFTLVYEDSLAAGNWEHNPEYFGPPAIFLYKVELS
jgi:hypothetical protein